jgi:hypothetical protein
LLAFSFQPSAFSHQLSAFSFGITLQKVDQFSPMAVPKYRLLTRAAPLRPVQSRLHSLELLTHASWLAVSRA